MMDRFTSRILRVFISYSHLDSVWRDFLLKHLKGFEHRYNIRVFVDELIRTGEWSERIEQEIASADLGICLLSPDYFASDHCFKELRLLIRRQRTSLLNLLLVQVEPTALGVYPELCEQQIHPSLNQSVHEAFPSQEDRFFADLMGVILELLEGRGT